MDDTASKLQPHLGRDEIILWSGHPGRGLRFRDSDLYAIPFSLLWLAICAFFGYNVVKEGGWLSFHALFLIPFVLVGLHAAVVRFFWDAWIRASQTYALTNDRILVKMGFPQNRLLSIALRNLGPVLMTEASGSNGSIMFDAPTSEEKESWTAFSPSGFGNGFEFIDNVQRVYDLIIDAQKKAVGSVGRLESKLRKEAVGQPEI